MTDVSKIISSGVFEPPTPPRDSWSFGTVAALPGASSVSVVIDGDDSATVMPCCFSNAAIGQRVLMGLIGRSRIAVAPISPAPSAFLEVKRAAAQDIGTSASAVNFSTEVEDNSGMFSIGQPDRAVVVRPGLYVVTASYRWAAIGASRLVGIARNGTAVAWRTTLGVNSGAYDSLSATLRAEAGDYLQVLALHQSTGTVQLFETRLTALMVSS